MSPTNKSDYSSPRCRVLHVIDSLDLGGAQEVLVNLIRHGDASKFSFEVATMHGRGVYWHKLRSLGVPLHSLSFNPRFPSYIPKIAWLCLRKRFDILHAHLTGANVIAKPIAALCGVPVRINHDHCNDKNAGPQRWIPKADRITNRFSTHIIAVSHSTRDFLINQEGISADRTSTIHNGIDLNVYQPRPELRAEARARFDLPEKAFIVAGIGRLTYQKNFSLFLEVAAAVIARKPQVFFVIAGTGEEESALRARAKELGIVDRVRFLGYVADMRQLYPAIDMQLLTSRYEGLPITILESMATGTNVVASRLDGIQEILVDGEDSALVSKGDVAAFTARICELVDSPQLAAKVRAAALSKVRNAYSAEAMTQAVESIYRKYWPSIR